MNDIKIITEDSNKNTRACLANYFRFIGVLVSESNPYQKEAYHNYDEILTVEDNLYEMSKEERIQYITNIIERFALDKKEKKNLCKLAQIYIENELDIIIPNIEYYIDYEKIAYQLLETQKQIPTTDDCSNIYAKDTLLTLIKRLYWLRQNDSLTEGIFNTQGLIQELNSKILNIGKDSAQARILQAQITATDIFLLGDAVVYYKYAIDELRKDDVYNAKYMGSLYYEIGKRTRKKEEKISYLKKSTEIDFDFYPSHYALGKVYEENKEYIKAISSYRKCEKSLENYQTIKEKDYLIKTEASMAEIFKSVGQRTEAIESYEKILSIQSRKDNIETGEETRKLGIGVTVYAELTKLYSACGNSEKSEYYWNLFQQKSLRK